MPYFCAVLGCDKNRNSNVVIHNFPRNSEQAKYWIKFCGREARWVPQKNQGICSIHFNDDNYDQRYQMRQELIGAKMRRTLLAKGSIKESCEQILIKNVFSFTV